MTLEITSIQDVIEEQHRLNRKKFILNQHHDQTWQDWIELAEAYAAIDSKANYSYCMLKAAYLGYFPESVKQEMAEAPKEKRPFSAQLPDKKYPWQDQKDLK